MKLYRPAPSKYETLLYNALKRRGIKSIAQYPDGHKSIDIAIPEARLYIEVDGIQHLNDPKQMIKDFTRDYYSTTEGFVTLHVHNDDLRFHLDSIADAIADVARPHLQSTPPIIKSPEKPANKKWKNMRVVGWTMFAVGILGLGDKLGFPIMLIGLTIVVLEKFVLRKSEE